MFVLFRLNCDMSTARLAVRTSEGIPRRQMGRELSAYNFGEISLRNPRGAERSETGRRGKGLEWMEEGLERVEGSGRG